MYPKQNNIVLPLSHLFFIISFPDLAEDEFSEEETMDFLAPNRRRSSSSREKRKLMGAPTSTVAEMDNIVIGAKPEREPLHFDKSLFDEGKNDDQKNVCYQSLDRDPLDDEDLM